MTIQFIAQAENSDATGVTTLVASTSLTLLTGDIVELQVYAATVSSNLTPSDGLGNTYTLQASSVAIAGGAFLYTYVAQNCASGTCTPQIVSTDVLRVQGVYAKQIRGGATSSAVIGSASTQQTAGSGANTLASGTVNIATAKNVLISGFTVNGQFQTPLATAGTSPLSFTGRTAVWSVLGGGTAFSVPEDLRVVSASGNVQATFGIAGGGAQFDSFGTNVTVYAELATNLAEGTSTGATTAATGQGTGGVAMPAIVVGQETDVLVGIQNSSLPSTLVVGDGSNTYTQIDNFNDAGNGYIWYRFASRATVALATPTLTATANAGYFPTSMSIAAAPLSGITGFTAGNVAHNQQLSPGGTDAQVSGFTPSLLGGAGINYTIAAFGFSSSKDTAPAAGTGFTRVATAWAALGTGACLTYETMQLGSGGAPVQATFTPTTSRAYTLVAAFNNIQFPVSPAGPMPRQIYIMP